MKVVSRTRKSRARATIRSCSRNEPAPAATAPIGALRVPDQALTTPTTMRTAITTPITR